MKTLNTIFCVKCKLIGAICKLIGAICIFLCFSANAQDLQLQGKLLNRQSDTVRVQVWSDGDLIVDRYTTNPFYALVLGERKHYTIKTTSGSVEKYCQLICYNMEFDNIQVDIDFRNRQSVVVYKPRKSSNKYTFIYYGSGTTATRDIPIYDTN